VQKLATAGLIEVTEDQISPTARIEQIQAALNLNLAELSKVGSRSMLVDPVFGHPGKSYKHTQVFVLMPFSEELAPVYEDHIKAVSEKVGLSVALPAALPLSWPQPPQPRRLPVPTLPSGWRWPAAGLLPPALTSR
jgi:hypothetical protein